MFKYFTTFISLFAIAFATNAQSFATADSLMQSGSYNLAAVEYERCYYLASSYEASQQALRQKAECYKRLQLYDRAASTLQRIASTYPDYLQLTLCLYLASNYQQAAQTAQTAQLLFDTTTTDQLILWTLSLNQQNLYDSAHHVARLLLPTADSLHQQQLSDTLDAIYARAPHLLNPTLAQWLSLLPGLGHLYAGYPLIAATTFTLNASILAFGLWQALQSYYLTAYIGGAGLLSTTYLGAMRSAQRHAEKTNQRRTATYNNTSNRQILNAFNW